MVGRPRLLLVAGGLLWMIAVVASIATDTLSPLLIVSEILIALGLLAHRQARHRLGSASWLGLALVAGGASGVVWPLLAAATVGVALFIVYPLVVLLGPAALSALAFVLAWQRRAALAVRTAAAMLVASLVALPLGNVIPETLPILALGFGVLAAAFGVVLPMERTSGVLSQPD